MSTLHCTLENGADLYVNEHQKIRHYRTVYLRKKKKKKEEEEKNAKSRIFTLRVAYVNCAIIVMLYTHLIGNQP